MAPIEHKYSLLAGHIHGFDYDHDPKGGKHLQLHVRENGTDHRVAVNVHSANQPDELLFHKVAPLTHPITALLDETPDGHHDLLDGRHKGLRLDYIAGGFGLCRAQMKVVPFIEPSENGTLKSILETLLADVLSKPGDHRVFAFGEPWGPEHRRRDRYFGFLPGRGIHDVHMNQGSIGPHRNDNRERQDGALILRSADHTWIGVFLAFQTQRWDPQ